MTELSSYSIGRLFRRRTDDEESESQTQWSSSDEEVGENARQRRYTPMKRKGPLEQAADVFRYRGTQTASESSEDSESGEDSDDVDKADMATDERLVDLALHEKTFNYQPQEDIWNYYLMFSFVQMHAGRQTVMFILTAIVLGLQIFIPIAMAVTLGKDRVASYKGHLEDYKDAQEHVNTRGFERLDASTAEELCGKFVDDFPQGLPYNDTITYKKWPTKDWQISNFVPNHRSVLDDCLFVLMPVSFFSATMFLISFLWTISTFSEAFEIFNFARMLRLVKTKKPDEVNQFCCGIEGRHFASGKDATTEKSIDLKKKHFGEDGKILELRSLPPCAKFTGCCIVVLRSFILIIVFSCGCWLFICTGSIAELIFNSLSLAFVLEIDNAFVILLPQRNQKFLRQIAIKPLKVFSNMIAYRLCELFIPLAALVVGALVACLLRFIQLRHTERMFRLVSSMCLFFGPTPDRQVKYDAVFPVPGFCESLLHTRCAVPEDWKDLRCTSFKNLKHTAAKAKENCLRYEDPRLKSGLSWEDWQQKAKTKDFCVSSYIQSSKRPAAQSFLGGFIYWFDKDVSEEYLSSISIPVPQLKGHLDHGVEWSGHLDSLRKTCLSLWQTSPAMKFLQVSDKSDLRNKKAPKTLPSDLESFPRMRDATMSEDVFAAPFACGWTDIMAEVLTPDVFDIANAGRFNEIAMDAALANCSKHPPAYTRGRIDGEPCTTHVQCLGEFCSKDGRCKESETGKECNVQKGMRNKCVAKATCKKECRECENGYNGYCGKTCQDENNITGKNPCKLPGEPTLSKIAKDRNWTVLEDWSREKWFYYNERTEISSWERPPEIADDLEIKSAMQAAELATTSNTQAPTPAPTPTLAGLGTTPAPTPAPAPAPTPTPTPAPTPATLASVCDWQAVTSSSCPCTSSDTTGCDLKECDGDMKPGEMCEADKTLPNGNAKYDIDNCPGDNDVFQYVCQACFDKTLPSGAVWKDKFGDSCDWYKPGNRCKIYGSDPDNTDNGITANQACCSCKASTCTDILVDGAPWKDDFGDDCEWFSQASGRCEEYGDEENKGINAKEACCTCKAVA